MLDILFVIVLLLNALWFGAGFRYFSLNADAAAKLLVSKEHRASPVFGSLVASARFLGGMNLAFSLMAISLLVFRTAFSEPHQIALICAVFAIAHGSQFAFNAPMALQERAGEPAIWPVLSGPMLFIFVIDAALTLANGVVATFAALS